MAEKPNNPEENEPPKESEPEKPKKKSIFTNPKPPPRVNKPSEEKKEYHIQEQETAA